MPKGILGKKLGMTQIFAEDGNVIPVTVIQAGPCEVIQVKSMEKDGYQAAQIGFGEIRDKLVNKPLKGHFSKAGVKPRRSLREIQMSGDVKVGQVLTCEIFQAGDAVDVTGTSKGHGFSGVIKRWNFHRGPMTHGSHYHRGVGSLGATGPARVFKGRKLAGRYGSDRVTIQGLEIVKVDPEYNLLLVKGSVPGIRGGTVLIRESVKK